MKIQADKSKLTISIEIDLADRDSTRNEIIRLKWLYQTLTRIWKTSNP